MVCAHDLQQGCGSGRMTPEPWYACVHVRELPAQALLRESRMQPAAGESVPRAMAVLEGVAPLERVCSMTRAAAQMGVEAGMTRVEAESFGGLELVPRSLYAEANSRALLLDCLAHFTPRVEAASAPNAPVSTLVLDLSGTERLFGTPRTIARQAVTQARALGLTVEIGLAQNFHVAVALARSARGISLAQAGQERQCLAGLPVTLLPMTEEQRETLATWGIRSMGELAQLPDAELTSRLGQAGRHLRLLARGEASHLFQPMEAPFLLREELELEEPLELLEPLLFCVSPMLGQVVVQAGERALAIAVLRVTAGLEGGGEYQREIRPAMPTYDRALLLKLVHLEMAAHPPDAGVRRLEIFAEAGPLSKVQLGLFAPQLPEPGRLDVTLARIRSIVGEGRVGWARLDDTHQENRCRMERFMVPDKKPGQVCETISCSALRRLRPAAIITVRLAGRAPRTFWYAREMYTVERSFGPWQRSGTWWSEEIWSTESWDVTAHTVSGELLLGVLANDRLSGGWTLEALYD